MVYVTTNKANPPMVTVCLWAGSCSEQPCVLLNVAQTIYSNRAEQLFAASIVHSYAFQSITQLWFLFFPGQQKMQNLPRFYVLVLGLVLGLLPCLQLIQWTWCEEGWLCRWICSLTKLVAAWMRILLILFIIYVSWVLVSFVTESSSLCFQTCDRNSGPRFCIMICLKFWVDCYVLYLHTLSQADESVRSHGSLSLPCVMEAMVWHFVSNSHKVMTAFIMMLPSNCFWGIFSAIS